MAENVLALKKKAVKLGMDRKDAMKANRKALEDFIASAGKKSSKTKSTKTVAKKKATKKTATKKKNTNTTKKSTASTTKKSTKRKTKASDSGRHMIDSLDFNNTDGWNPRSDSPVNAIFKALKKAKGDVDKATAALLDDVKDFVSTKKRDGTRRTKDEMLAALRYRVNRTKWEFATRTGQHEASGNRVEYGTGDYAQNSKPKPKTAKKSTKKTNSKGTKKTTKRKKTKK